MDDVVSFTATLWLAGRVIAIGKSCNGPVWTVVVGVGVIVIVG